MEIYYSFIIPVYNRPEEIKELLESIQLLSFEKPYEVVIMEDGSTRSSGEIVEKFRRNIDISYYPKTNTGPGDSRNYGMKKAKGNYFLILDSDVILPPDYLCKVDRVLQQNFVHCFGGPDAAHKNFTMVQKAINYAMTSLLTTGGIRGSKMNGNFQPRSFNMGISKEAFEKSGGFGKIHPGEDPDLAMRLRELGYETRLFHQAVVFHKRRVDWEKFYEQVYKFGQVRPVLNKWHPGSGKITYWFPTIFSLGLLTAILLLILKIQLLLYVYFVYFFLIFLHASILNKSFRIGLLSIWASLVQFLGYGLGFWLSTYYIGVLNENPEKKFPKLFFKHAR